MGEVQLSKAHPVVFYAFLSSLNRFDPITAVSVSKEFGVNIEGLEKLSNRDRFLSDAPVRRLTDILRGHSAFLEISRIAGELAFARVGFRFTGIGLASLLKEAMVSLGRVLPGITSEVLDLPVPRITVRNSPFVAYPSSSPTCGFISGFVSSALLSGGMKRFRILETICGSVSAGQRTCLFEVGDFLYEA